MQLRPLGNTGILVSPIGLGGWLTVGHSVGSADADRVIRAALDRGINFFDSADGYANGEAERAIGRVLGPAGGVRRESVVISTKVFWPTSADPSIKPDPEDKGLSRARILRQVEFSLRNLRTDYLDVYFCHMWDPQTPVPEIVGTMDGLVKAGKIRSWGMSNWPHHGVDQACRFAVANGLAPPALNQPAYSLLDRDIERWLLATIARWSLSLTTYSPLAGGLLAGGFGSVGDLSVHRREQARWRHLDDARIEKAVGQVARLTSIAERLGARPAQVAIAWLLTRPCVSCVITGASSPEQVEQNAGAADLTLDAPTRRELAEVFPPPRLGVKELARLAPMLLRAPAAVSRYRRMRA